LVRCADHDRSVRPDLGVVAAVRTPSGVGHPPVTAIDRRGSTAPVGQRRRLGRGCSRTHPTAAANRADVRPQRADCSAAVASSAQRLVLLGEGSLPAGEVPERHDGWAQVFVDRVDDSDQVRIAAYADNQISADLWDLDVTDAQARLALGLREVLPRLELSTADVKRWRYANAVTTADWDASHPVSESVPIWIAGDGVGEPDGELLGVHRAVTSASQAAAGITHHIFPERQPN